MSKTSQIRTVIKSLLDSKCVFSLEEVRERMEEEGIPLEPYSSAVRNTMSRMMEKDSHIVRIDRGVYGYRQTDATGNAPGSSPQRLHTETEVDRAVYNIVGTLSSLLQTNWLSCSQEELLSKRKLYAIIENGYRQMEALLQGVAHDSIRAMNLTSSGMKNSIASPCQSSTYSCTPEKTGYD